MFHELCLNYVRGLKMVIHLKMTPQFEDMQGCVSGMALGLCTCCLVGVNMGACYDT